MKFKILPVILLIVILSIGSTAYATGDAYWRIGPSFTPVVPTVGDTVSIRGTVSLNHGTYTDVLVRGGVGGITMYTHTIPILNEGDMIELSFTTTFGLWAGDHNLWFEIDPEHTLDDTNRDGDRWEQTVTVRTTGQPNLKFGASSFSVTPTTFTAGESVTFHYCIMNNGTADAGPFDVGLKVDGVIVQRHHYDGVAASSGGGCNDFTWTAVCGTDVKMVVDCDNAVTESNETDNAWDDSRLECDASWHESKNFWLENIRPDTSTTPLAQTSSPTTITADLRYEGSTGSRTYQTKVIMGIVGRAPLRTETFTGLALPGDATTPVSFSTVLPVGTTRVFFQVDPDREIAEINESDNRTEADIIVVGASKSRSPAPTSSKSKFQKTVPFDYIMEIKNKATLKKTIFKPGTEVKVDGSLKVIGKPTVKSIKVKADFYPVQKIAPKKITPALTLTKSIRVSPDSTVNFAFKKQFKTKGKYRVVVSVDAKDANAKNNKDTADFSINDKNLKINSKGVKAK